MNAGGMISKFTDEKIICDFIGGVMVRLQNGIDQLITVVYHFGKVLVTNK